MANSIITSYDKPISGRALDHKNKPSNYGTIDNTWAVAVGSIDELQGLFDEAIQFPNTPSESSFRLNM